MLELLGEDSDRLHACQVLEQRLRDRFLRQLGPGTGERLHRIGEGAPVDATLVVVDIVGPRRRRRTKRIEHLPEHVIRMLRLGGDRARARPVEFGVLLRYEIHVLLWHAAQPREELRTDLAAARRIDDRCRRRDARDLVGALARKRA